MTNKTETELLQDAIRASGGTCDDLPDTLPSTLLKKLIETCSSGGGGSGGGLPTGGAPHQQLVTDGDGNAKWEDRLCYTEHFQGEILPETELTLMEEAALYVCAEPLTNKPFLGENCTVILNGVTYNCVSKEVVSGGIHMITLGNAYLFGGEYSEDPFFIAFVPEEASEEMGGVTVMCMPLSGTESVTLSITGEGERVKQIDNKYLDVKDKIYIVEMEKPYGSSHGISTNTTLDEIVAAHEDGKIVFCRIVCPNSSTADAVVFPLNGISLNGADFIGFCDGNTDALPDAFANSFIMVRVGHEGVAVYEVEPYLYVWDDYRNNKYRIGVDADGNITTTRVATNI